jgi:hypothetical protein
MSNYWEGFFSFAKKNKVGKPDGKLLEMLLLLLMRGSNEGTTLNVTGRARKKDKS